MNQDYLFVSQLKFSVLETEPGRLNGNRYKKKSVRSVIVNILPIL